MLEMVPGQPQSVVTEFVHDLGDRLGLVEYRGELAVGIAPVVGRGCVLTVVGDVDVTGIDRHEFVDHLLSSPGGGRGGTAPETRAERAPIPGTAQSTRFSRGEGKKKSVRKSASLGGTVGSNLSSSSGESGANLIFGLAESVCLDRGANPRRHERGSRRGRRPADPIPASCPQPADNAGNAVSRAGPARRRH